MARRKEKAAAAHAGEQAARAMLHAHTDTLVKAGMEPLGKPSATERPDDWWYYAEQAVRMARLAAYHAFKARPNLKPMDSYDTAVAEGRQMQVPR